MDLWPGSHLLSRRHRHHNITPERSSSEEGGHNYDPSPIPLKTVYIQKYQILLFASDLLHRGVANPVDMYKTRVSAMLCGRHVAATESTHNGAGSDNITLTEDTCNHNSSSESSKDSVDAELTGSLPATAVNNSNSSKDGIDSAVNDGSNSTTTSKDKEQQAMGKTVIKRGKIICLYIHYYTPIHIYSYLALVYYIYTDIQQSAKVKHESIPSFEIYFNPRGHNSDQFMKTYFLDYDVGVSDTVTEND